jgi:hypothetical protein
LLVSTRVLIAFDVPAKRLITILIALQIGVHPVIPQARLSAHGLKVAAAPIHLGLAAGYALRFKASICEPLQFLLNSHFVKRCFALFVLPAHITPIKFAQILAGLGLFNLGDLFPVSTGQVQAMLGGAVV